MECGFDRYVSSASEICLYWRQDRNCSQTSFISTLSHWHWTAWKNFTTTGREMKWMESFVSTSISTEVLISYKITFMNRPLMQVLWYYKCTIVYIRASLQMCMLNVWLCTFSILLNAFSVWLQRHTFSVRLCRYVYDLYDWSTMNRVYNLNVQLCVQ